MPGVNPSDERVWHEYWAVLTWDRLCLRPSVQTRDSIGVLRILPPGSRIGRRHWPRETLGLSLGWNLAGKQSERMLLTSRKIRMEFRFPSSVLFGSEERDLVLRQDVGKGIGLSL